MGRNIYLRLQTEDQQKSEWAFFLGLLKKK